MHLLSLENQPYSDSVPVVYLVKRVAFSVSDWISFDIQRFSEVPDQLGMAVLSVTPGNPLLWTFLMQNFTLGIDKMSVISENPLFPNPVLPKISVTLYTDSKQWRNLTCNILKMNVWLDIFGSLYRWIYSLKFSGDNWAPISKQGEFYTGVIEEVTIFLPLADRKITHFRVEIETKSCTMGFMRQVRR